MWTKGAAACAALSIGLLIMISCGGSKQPDANGGDGDSNGTGTDVQFNGVLMWKGNITGNGVYASEKALTPQNVNPGQFGKIGEFYFTGVVASQPLYVEGVDMGAKGVHNIAIVTTERDEVLAFDVSTKTGDPIWRRSYLEPGVTTAPDNYGGRSTMGGEIGITGTPVVDPATGAMYFVTMLSRNGVIEQWLRSIDIRTGADYGVGSMQIKASVAGDSPGNVNGQIVFDPSIQNQRPGLVLFNGNVLIAWGSFSDWGVYRGWLMAYDKKTLQQTAVFSPATQFQAEDDAHGPADHGGGAAFWGAGALPSIDASGNIYLVGADGSFNADKGGRNYGDTVLKLRMANGTFQVVDYFSPANRACVDEADLEIGSGGVVLLPNDASVGQSRALTINKEGRVYLLDSSKLGNFTTDDSQIPQQFLINSQACFEGMGTGYAEGKDWFRLYGNPTYWNGSVYIAPANTVLRQYKFANGVLNTNPASQAPAPFGTRGGGTVISSNGPSNGIVWAYNKNPNGMAELHAYDANDVSRELWSSTMNPTRDMMGAAGASFGIPVVANGKIIVASTNQLQVYGPLQ